MVVSAKETLGMPVVGLQESMAFGKIGGFVVSPKKLSVLCVVIKKSFLNPEDKIVYFKDLREIGSNGVVIDSAEDIVMAEDVIEVKDLMGQGYRLFGAKVFTESGQKLGKVTDFKIDPIALSITSLEIDGTIKKIFRGKLLISRSAVIKVEPDKIIVKDTLLKQAAAKVAPSLAVSR